MPRRLPAILLALLAMQLVSGFWGDPMSGIVGISLAQLLTAALIAVHAIQVAQGQGKDTILATPVFGWVGRMSYAIYLWHYPIARLTRAVLPFWPSFLACLALSSALAWFSWHTVEHLGRRARARMDAAAGSGDSQVGMPEAAR